MNDNTGPSEEEMQRKHDWFQAYVARIESAVVPEPVMIHPVTGKSVYRCPCCGYPTLAEPGKYDICSLCHWEDDGQNDPHADEVWGGPNKIYSLTEARRNFGLYGTKYRPGGEPRIGGADSDVQRQAKRKMQEAFDAMAEPGIDDAAWADLWRVVDEGEATLLRELLRKAAAYEESMKSVGDS